MSVIGKRAERNGTKKYYRIDEFLEHWGERKRVSLVSDRWWFYTMETESYFTTTRPVVQPSRCEHGSENIVLTDGATHESLLSVEYLALSTCQVDYF